MTERAFLQWLKKAGKKWKSVLSDGDIRLRVGKEEWLCPLEAVQALKLGTPFDDCWYTAAARDLGIKFSVAPAADNLFDKGERGYALRSKMLKALGLKEKR